MKRMIVSLNQRILSYIDIGLLIFRLGIGGMFMWHGLPKITGGVVKWIVLGKSMEILGIQFAPAFWGFMSGFAEFVGGLFFAIGFIYRPTCLLLVSNMFVAFSTQMLEGKGMLKAAQSLEDGFSFIGAFFVGPGKYSVDEYLGLHSSPRRRPY
ncbi:MAG: DoxX family protein [Firmicutes bacterium]|nr:DoxX family protein [Bacillota bacterium]